MKGVKKKKSIFHGGASFVRDNSAGKKNFVLRKKSPKKDSLRKKLDLSKPIQWTQNMSVEEKNIDAQHKNLVRAINLLLIEIKKDEEIGKIREVLHFLESYVVEHFSYEEEYMRLIKFPGLRKHHNVHQSLVDFFVKFKNNFNKNLSGKVNSSLPSIDLSKMILELRDYLANWLIHHMLGDDQQFHAYAQSKKLLKKDFAKQIWGKLNLKPKISDVSGKITSEVNKKIIPFEFKPLKDVPSLGQGIKKKLISKQRVPAVKSFGKDTLKEKTIGEKSSTKKYIWTGIEGFDELLDSGIPEGNAMIVAGGAGSGKTIFCLQILANKATEGKKCLYITLEEREDRLLQHMEDFGWPARKFMKNKKLKIWRMNPFDITRNVEALLAKQKGELLIDVDPVLLPKDCCNPDFIVIDSLTAIASAFTGKEDSYRIYIEQLFRFLEKTRATSFLITETEQVPKIFSQTGVEEFLADGVIVLYAIKHGNVRENALEILKLRGASHQKNIVAMQITEKGIVIYPEQEVFSELE